MTISPDMESKHDLGATQGHRVNGSRDRSHAGGGGVGPSDIATLRERLGLDGSLDDLVIWSSLKEIGRFAESHARLQAAFDSTLGQWLALHRSDLASALAQVIAASPAHHA